VLAHRVSLHPHLPRIQHPARPASLSTPWCARTSPALAWPHGAHAPCLQGRAHTGACAYPARRRRSSTLRRPCVDPASETLHPHSSRHSTPQPAHARAARPGRADAGSGGRVRGQAATCGVRRACSGAEHSRKCYGPRCAARNNTPASVTGRGARQRRGAMQRGPPAPVRRPCARASATSGRRSADGASLRLAGPQGACRVAVLAGPQGAPV
jgi:hypothetical protein